MQVIMIQLEGKIGDRERENSWGKRWNRKEEWVCDTGRRSGLMPDKST